MKLILKHKTIIQAATANLNNFDLELIDISNIKNYDISLFEVTQKIQHSSINDEFSSDDLFYYRIERYTDVNIKDIYEIGIGSTYSVNNKNYLKRIKPMVFGVVGGKSQLSINGPQNFYGMDDYMLVVSQYIPQSMQEFFFQENTIVASKSGSIFSPVPITIDNNSVVGRLDGDISSVSISEILQQETDLIKFSGNNIKNNHKGSLRYNSKKNKLEFYNGKKWLSIMCEE